MIVEHLLEPHALVKLAESHRNCKDFVKEFTKPSPRVIAEFPKLKKLRQITLQTQLSTAKEMEKKRLEEILVFITEQKLVKKDLIFDGMKHFQQNMKVAELKGFTGIHFLKSKENVHKLNQMIIGIDDFENGIDSLDTQHVVPKVVEEITNALASLLIHSQNIVIVDPYFDCRPGIWLTFLGILRKCASSSLAKNKSIEVLFSSNVNRKNAKSPKYLIDQLKKEKPQLANSFKNISLKDIEEIGTEAIHNRYIITELAGVSLGYGLEQTNEKESDDFCLLNEKLYGKRYDQYVKKSSFNILDEASI